MKDPQPALLPETSPAACCAAKLPLSSPAVLPLGAMMVASLLGVTPAAQAASEATMPTVTVKAAAESETPGYLAGKTRVGKVVQDPHDVPQAITTITRSLIEEQEANSLREALRNVSGLSFNAAEGGRSGDNMMLRGFYTFGDMYLDGIRDTAQYNREVFNLEQVDVLRGAAAMLFGRGQAGGVINQVSKTPKLYGTNKVSAGVGTDGYLETKADLNQALGESTALRLNLMQREEGSPRSNPATGASPENQRTGVAASVAFGLETDHEVTLSHLLTKSNDRPDYGIPFANARPNQDYAKSGAYWGLSNTFDDSQTNVTTLSSLYKISPDTQWRNVARYGKYQRAYWASAPGNASSFCQRRQRQDARIRNRQYRPAKRFQHRLQIVRHAPRVADRGGVSARGFAALGLAQSRQRRQSTVSPRSLFHPCAERVPR